MSKDPAEILEAALALNVEVRAALITSLIESLDPGVDDRAEEQWEQEIQRRLAALDSKTVSPVPWAVVRARLMDKLRNDPQSG